LTLGTNLAILDLMAKKFYEEDEFLDLRDEWYAKLKEEGFDDIEMVDQISRQPEAKDGHILLRGPARDLVRSKEKRQYVASQEEYYRLARQLVWELPFGPYRHVVAMHAEGHSASAIFDALGERYNLSKTAVTKMVKQVGKTLRQRARGE
jgi:hypothetical protein